MPDSNDLREARERATVRLGGTAKSNAAGEAQKAANEAVTNLYISFLAQLDLYLADGREKSLAVTKIEESKMWAVKSIFADNGK